MSAAEAAEVEIRDGTTLLLRPIEPDDKRALADGFDRLSPESRYRRFFAPMSRLRGTDLRYLTEIDHRDHEAILAVVPTSGEAIGVARYVRGEEDPTTAEVAVAVVDDWHGRGVATALLDRLVDRARENGVKRFLALVLADNAEAIELFRQLSVGDPTPHLGDSGYVELEIELPEGASLPHAPLRRALRAAAGGKIEIDPLRVLKRVTVPGRHEDR